MAQKQVAVTEHAPGTRFVAKKTSIITRAKWVFVIVSVLWLGFAAYAPLYVKNHYSGPIKKSIVVSMFFDLQRNIAAQYEKLLAGIKDSINLEKPIAEAIKQVKVAQDATATVTDTTAKAKTVTDNAKTLTGIAGKFGVKTGGVDNAINKAAGTVARVDDTANLVNEKLDDVQTKLVRVSQTEVDKMIDTAIKNQLDKSSGGLGTTMLTNYGIQHVYPWRPSSWPVATKIYDDLSRSNVGVLEIITNTVDKYFGYVAWGLVIAAWAVGLFVWMQIRKWYKLVTAPFIVCPNCGYTFADKKRVGLSLLKIFQPWNWI